MRHDQEQEQSTTRSEHEQAQNIFSHLSSLFSLFFVLTICSLISSHFSSLFLISFVLSVFQRPHVSIFYWCCLVLVLARLLSSFSSLCSLFYLLSVFYFATLAVFYVIVLLCLLWSQRVIIEAKREQRNKRQERLRNKSKGAKMKMAVFRGNARCARISLRLPILRVAVLCVPHCAAQRADTRRIGSLGAIRGQTNYAVYKRPCLCLCLCLCLFLVGKVCTNIVLH